MFARYLLEIGHEVDVLDNSGWPPLLYANLETQAKDRDEECMLALLKARPDHLTVLGRLLKNPTNDVNQTRRNRLQVTKVITSIATHDAYYSVLNKLLRVRDPIILTPCPYDPTILTPCPYDPTMLTPCPYDPIILTPCPYDPIIPSLCPLSY